MPTRRKRPVLYEIVRHTRRSSELGWRDKRAREEAQSRIPAEPLRASPAPAVRPAAPMPAPMPAPEPAQIQPAPPPAAPNFAPTAPNFGDLAPATPASATPAPARSPRYGPMGSRTAALRSSPGKPAPAPAPSNAVRAIRFADGRLLLDLAWPGIAATAVLVIVLLALTFQVGKRSSQPKRPDVAVESETPTPVAAIPAAPSKMAEPTVAPRETRPSPTVPSHRPSDNTQVAVPALPPRAVEAPPQTAQQPQPLPQQPPAEQVKQQPSPLKAGYHYVVAQHFPLKDKDAAIDAARFLQANGVDAFVNVRKADIEVIATKAFQIDQKDQSAKKSEQKACEALKEKIRAVGVAFVKQQRAAKKPEYALDQPAERMQK